MSTLDTSYYKRLRGKYLVFSVSCLIFSIIYEAFSHNVYSNYMMFSFLIPLIFGCIGTFILKNTNINSHSLTLYHLSIITFTVGSIVKGILDIYGTTNSLVYVYLIVGIFLIAFSIVVLIMKKKS